MMADEHDGVTGEDHRRQRSTSSKPVEQDADDRDDDTDADDRALSEAERQAAEQAALDAVGGGTVEQVEASDDRGQAYEVEVRDSDNNEWDVELDADYQVLRKTAGD